MSRNFLIYLIISNVVFIFKNTRLNTLQICPCVRNTCGQRLKKKIGCEIQSSVSRTSYVFVRFLTFSIILMIGRNLLFVKHRRSGKLKMIELNVIEKYQNKKKKKKILNNYFIRECKKRNLE